MLTISTGGPNNAYIVDTAGGLQMNNSTVANLASTFDILVQNGNLTSFNDSTRDVGNVNVILEVTGVTSTIGNDAANSLEINATASFTATSAGGNIFVEDGDIEFPWRWSMPTAATYDLRSVTAITDANGAANNVSAAARPPAGLEWYRQRTPRDRQSARWPPATPAHDREHPVANSVGGLLTIGTVNGLVGRDQQRCHPTAAS